MKLKKITLLLIVVMIISCLTGCMQLEVGLEFNADNTGKMIISSAVNKEILGEEENSSNNFSVDLLENEALDMKNVDVSTEIIKFEQDGNNYEGEKTIIKFSDTEQFLKSYAENAEAEKSLTLIDLPNGNKRLEIYPNMDNASQDMLEGEEGDIDATDLYNLISMMGGKIAYTIKTDYKAINHNADKVENGVYTWDILKRLAQDGNLDPSLVFFIEYEPKQQTQPSSFSDVKESDWFYKDVMFLTSKNAIAGYTDGRYGPNDIITKAQFVKIATTCAIDTPITPSPKGIHWATNYMKVATNLGIINDKELPKSEWDKPITRYEMARILVKVTENILKEEKSQTSGVSKIMGDYATVRSKKEFTYYVEQAYMKGLIAGVNQAGTFAGHEYGNRAQSAAMISRMLIKENRVKLPTLKTK